MTDRPKHNALVAFAALTGLLAKHPELSAAPASWSYDQTGITVMMTKSASLAVFEQIAAAFKASTHGGTPFVRDGVTTEQYYLDAELAGIPVFGSVTLRVETAGDES